MLWQRVLTALVLIPLVIGGVLLLDTPVFAALMALLLLVGAYELGRLAQLRSMASLAVFLVLIALVLWLAWRFLLPLQIVLLQGVMTVWWVVITVLMLSRRRDLERTSRRRPAILALGALVLLTAWISIVSLHATAPYGPALVLFLFVLIWVADSGAYFAGRAFGRRKLAPFVSPGKTWAGAAGAAAGAALSAVLLALSGVVGDPPVALWTLLCVLVTVLSIGGDLWESRLKREAGVKDSGSLLPGHGGMLDRIDSLLAAAPVFALGAWLIGVTA